MQGRGNWGAGGQLSPPYIHTSQWLEHPVRSAEWFWGYVSGNCPEIKPCILKVSKSQKQISKFSHTLKNQRDFVHFFALASKSDSIKKKQKLFIVLNSPQLVIQIIKCY